MTAWFRRNQRPLPWRRTKDPYRIWVSEIMLQQTRAAAVEPYYERFLQRFPDLRALAGSSDAELLRCWSGLGYYSRARNLRWAAQHILSRLGGRFPTTYEQWKALPGVGPYTAAAVASIAFGAPVAVLDGNVARVMARVANHHG
ncbi:MAG TPA: A/G-specific adenine glycosylase, partial [Bryobacterales bacterium]|nr:A/G-specific adenine glycosylase [Bryobacterales bacterium]